MFFKLLTFAGLFALIVISIALNDFKNALITPASPDHIVTIEINRGDSFNQITDKLLAQQVDFKPIWFEILALQQKAAHKIKAGEYEIPAGLTLPQILAQLVEGKSKQYSITFPEGWSLKDILATLKNNPNIDHTLQPTDDLNVALKIDTALMPKSLEGLFFPDTYFFEKHTTDITLLKKAYSKMQRILAKEWAAKAENLPILTPYETQILASIIEKETGPGNERPLISGVFIRRLKSGMLLQTDPTVIYGMQERYQGNISAEDLKTESPYNTYIMNGLPPTPIAMPGKEAIYAALHPDNSKNIYFVAKGDGTHQFSSTLKDHNQAVNKFQRKPSAPR